MVQEFTSHDGHTPGNAHNAFAVVAHRANDAGELGAMAFIVIGIVRVVERIQTVAAIGWAEPHVFGQVLVSIAHAGVDHRHDDVAGGNERVPCFGRIDVGIGPAPILADIVQSPQTAIGIAWIIRIACCVYPVIRSGVGHQAALFIF